jgi:hypothetical protein
MLFEKCDPGFRAGVMRLFIYGFHEQNHASAALEKWSFGWQRLCKGIRENIRPTNKKKPLQLLLNAYILLQIGGLCGRIMLKRLLNA